MGVCKSQIIAFEVSPVDGQDLIAMEAFEKMKLQPIELNLLFDTYCKIDCSREGYIRPDEFRDFFRVDPTPFNKLLFNDYSSRGRINFFEFVATLWNFLATDPAQLGLFAFYFAAKDDHMVPDRVRTFLELLYGGKIDGNKVYMAALNDLTGVGENKMEHNMVQAKEFANYCLEHSVLMAPLLRTQLAMRKDFLGEPFWKKLTARRDKDPITSQQEFIYAITGGVVKQYYEKNAKLKYDERLKKLGKDRDGIAEVYEGHVVKTTGSAGIMTGDEVTFDHTKVHRKEVKDDKNDKKKDFIRMLADDAAIEVMNHKNCPEKLHMLETHQFRYVSDGMGPAAPGTGEWGSVVKLKPSSPRGRGSPRGSPRGTPKDSPRSNLPPLQAGRHSNQVHVDGDGPARQRGSSLDRPKSKLAGDVEVEVDINRTRSVEGRLEKHKRNPESDVGVGIMKYGSAEGYRPRSRGSNDSPRRASTPRAGSPRSASPRAGSPRAGSPRGSPRGVTTQPQSNDEGSSPRVHHHRRETGSRPQSPQSPLRIGKAHN